MLDWNFALLAGAFAPSRWTHSSCLVNRGIRRRGVARRGRRFAAPGEMCDPKPFERSPAHINLDLEWGQFSSRGCDNRCAPAAQYHPWAEDDVRARADIRRLPIHHFFGLHFLDLL